MVIAKEYYAKNRATWRKWLEKNHEKENRVWLLMHKKQSSKPSVNYVEAVEEALCFGWIDSTARKRDDNSFIMYFSKRKPGSVWSKINKGRIKKLIRMGLMTTAGLEKIVAAKVDGSWTALDAVEELTMPADLKKSFFKNKKALANFEAFPPSARKAIYYWISSAKGRDTRIRRVKETVTLAAKNVRANEWKPKR